jgi:DNA-binding MarR family transcriptional regulator
LGRLYTVQLLENAARRLRSEFEQGLGPVRLSMDQLSALLAIEQQDHLPVPDLANTLASLPRSAVAALLVTLEKRRLVLRQKARSNLETDRLSLSTAGRKLLWKAKSVAKKVEAESMAAIPKEDSRALRSILLGLMALDEGSHD